MGAHRPGLRAARRWRARRAAYRARLELAGLRPVTVEALCTWCPSQRAARRDPRGGLTDTRRRARRAHRARCARWATLPTPWLDWDSLQP